MEKHMTDLLPLILDNELPEQDRKKAQQHLQGCASCRKAWEDLVHENRVLEAWRDVRPSTNLVAKTMRAVQDRAEKEGQSVSWLDRVRVALGTFPQPARIMATAALFLVFGSAGLFLKTGMMLQRSAARQARLEIVPCDKGSYYDDYKVVAVAVAPGEDPISLLDRVNTGEASIISVKEEN